MKANLHLSLKISWEKQTLKMSLSFPKFLRVRKKKEPHNSLSSCWSFFVTVRVFRQPYASFSHSYSFNQIQNSQFPLYGIRLRFLRLTEEDLFKNFQKVSQDEHLVKVSKQYSAFGSTKLRPSYNMVILGQNTVYAEKLERRYIVGYFIYYVPVK